MPQWLTDADWPHAGAVVLMTIGALAGVVLTLLTLPGTWVALVTALGIKLWQPDLFDWWVLAVALVLALIGEAIEFGAGALGAAKAGASRRGALGAIVGSIVGAILGSPFFFPIGTILGGVAGAAAGTLVMERGTTQKSWGEASRAGAGAAAGRLVATLAKTGVAAVIALLLAVAVWFK